MTLANKFTASRLVLAPVFLIIYLLPRFFPSVFEAPPFDWALPFHIGALWVVLILWILFIASEVTDLLDGIVARKRGEISDFGKLFDPFADTLTQVTYFFCFVIDGILPPFLFLAVLYREFSILFIRNLMLRKGIAMGARTGGKIKTVAYVLAAGFALLAASIQRLGIGGDIYQVFIIIASVVFGISVLIAIISFFDYVSIYRNTSKQQGTGAGN
ncbi:MAG: CDP-diacylglycerol--glycerol-3-phosphate 3-phosphatidyltransferase [Treponema sp.]|nr:CDP-diacylglycerol--glycerol-3-phosphate 3-phosphatidyltransferase [Treponema sp.]